MTTTKNPTAPALTFAHLVALEPELGDLLAEAIHLKTTSSRGFCANAVWPGLKERMRELVGYASGRAGVLGTSAAYDIAYRTIYQALPRCRHRGGCARRGRAQVRRPLGSLSESGLVVVRASDIVEPDGQ